MTTSAQARYSSIAILLHWTLAVLITINLLIGFFHENMADETRAFLMGQHFAIGLTVLFLTVVRIVWRLIHPVPPANPAHPGWERALAKTVHFLFYALLLAMPILGWLILSTGRGNPISIFGLFEVSALPVARDEATHDLYEELHELGGWGFVGLIALHVVGALKHHIVDKDSTLGRMIPIRSWRER